MSSRISRLVEIYRKFINSPYLIFGLFLAFLILAVGNLLIQYSSAVDPFGYVNRVVAQVTGRPGPNTGSIVGALRGYQSEDGSLAVEDSYDRCLIIDPNLGEPRQVGELSSLSSAAIGDNLGGINLAPVIDFADFASTPQYQKSFEVGTNMGMSFMLAMTTTKNSTSFMAQFVDEAAEAGFVPVVRLCYVGGCDFNIAGSAADIINYYRDLSNKTSNEFIALLGPNEPGTGDTQEMEAFGVARGDYGTLVARANEAAAALQPQRVANGGNMYLAPAAFNVTNAINDDAARYFGSGLATSLFDIILINTYNLAGRGAYEFYKTTASGFPLRETVASSGLTTVVTEFGTFTETNNFDELEKNFDQFCQDDTVEGVMFFRSFESLADIQPEPHPNLIPDDTIGDIVSGCSKSSLRDWSWANCNFDSCLYTEPYDSKSVARACGIDKPTVPDDINGGALKIVCDGAGCSTRYLQTVEVSLPIKQFGSNSYAGTPNFNYTPLCAELAHSFSNGLYDPINQFAGTLQGSGGLTYPMPWLGSAINCSSELIQATNLYASDFTADFNPSPGSELAETMNEVRSELQNPALYEYGFSVDGQPALDGGGIITDERALCFGENCIDKISTKNTQAFGSYLPAGLSQNYKNPDVCAVDDLVVRNEPNNYIIGPEVVVSGVQDGGFTGGGSDVCFQYAIRNTDNPQADPRFKARGNISCTVIDNTQRPVPQVGSYNCLSMVNQFVGPDENNPLYLEGEVNLQEFQKWCLEYNASEADEIYYTTAAYASAPDFSIPGIYDSLAEMYKRTQFAMSRRYMKIVFRENIGWEMKVTSKMRDANRTYGETPYFYNQELNSCNVPDNLFNNEFYLAKGQPQKTTSQYFSWLGYLDIMQEWTSVYARDQIGSAEQTIPNPLLSSEFNDLKTPDELNKDFVLVSGTASQNTRFPIWTCDEVALHKIGIGIDGRMRPYRLEEEDRLPSDYEPTCIDIAVSDVYEDGLGEFLCKEGYVIPGICEDQPIIPICEPGSENPGGESPDFSIPDEPLTDEQFLLYPVGSDNEIPQCTEPSSGTLRQVNTDRNYYGGENTLQDKSGFILNSQAADALERMMNAMRDENPEAYNSCGFNWGYRSADLQRSFGGSCGAGTGTACACFSEHQLGTAVDFRPADGRVVNQFNNTSCYNWLVENASSYGYIRSYFPGNPDNYSSETWHWRWLPQANANEFSGNSASYGGHLKNYLIETYAEIYQDGGSDDEPSTGGEISLIYPTKVTAVSSKYGQPRSGYWHAGVDFGVPLGTQVVAAADGTVQVAGQDPFNPSGAYGIVVKIVHDNGWSTLYAHNTSVLVSVGQRVRQGQPIALSGNTGNSTGPHVHLELRRDPNCGWDGRVNPANRTCTVDPIPYLNGVPLDGGTGDPICIPPDQIGAPTTPGKLSCNIDTGNLSDQMDWEEARNQIDARVRSYNLDNNASYTWLGNLEFADSDRVRDGLIAKLGSESAYNQDLQDRRDVTSGFLDGARSRGINPRFAYSIWVEETAGSAIGRAALGCLYFRDGRVAGEMPVGGSKQQMVDHLNEQLDCLKTYVDEFPNFTHFMCTYSGEVGRPNCNEFVNNPHFPVNVCRMYQFLAL
jgi:murein DD-endopeptidase MepM/ murein hydrolase activator NlpD